MTNAFSKHEMNARDCILHLHSAFVMFIGEGCLMEDAWHALSVGNAGTNHTRQDIQEVNFGKYSRMD